MRQHLPTRAVLRQGVTYGAIGWLSGVGLVLLLVLLASGPARLLQQLPIAVATVLWSDLHGWAAVVEGQPGLLFVSTVPASVLVGMGYLAARATASAPEPGLVRGAWITAGYLPLVVLGFVWVLVRVSMLSGSVGAILSWNLLGLVLPIVATGLVFPLIFGALGGRLFDWRSGAGAPAE